jgi:hypothetical protein
MRPAFVFGYAFGERIDLLAAVFAGDDIRRARH